MQFATDDIGVKIEAAPGLTGACPLCHDDVIPKCGSIVAWHWAHIARADCDPWAEHETRWHRYWKSLVPKHCVEVPRAGHRADIVRFDGTIVELQHSAISPGEIRERESAYGKMVWLFDGRDLDLRLDLRDRGDYFSFRWKHPRKSWATCRRPRYIDLGRRILWLKKIHLDKGPPYGGWGRIGSHPNFVAWLTKGW